MSGKDSKDYAEDSDSSDGTSPATPRKTAVDRSNVRGASDAASGRQGQSVQTSPLTSPTKVIPGPSPKRNLFSRPTKMNIKTDAKEIANKGDPRDYASPTSPPGHYFSSQQAEGSSTNHGNTSTSLSSLLKHAGQHVPPILHHHNHHLHHHHLLPHHHNSGASSAAKSGPAYSGATRGRSFDMLRIANSGNDSTQPPPISPSFFSTAASTRSGSFSLTNPGLPLVSGDSDDSWPLICARVLPLFNGDGLRQPIEDLNRLVATHLRRCTESGQPTVTAHEHLLEDITELFELGVKSLDNNLAGLADGKLTTRLAEIWTFFFSTVLPYLEASFLPVTIALSGEGTESVHRIACQAYRDILILPLSDRLNSIFTRLPLLLSTTTSPSSAGGSSSAAGGNNTTTTGDETEVFSRMLQCISILRRVQSRDEGQRTCDELGNAVLFRRAKGRGDRRGIVALKCPPVVN